MSELNVYPRVIESRNKVSCCATINKNCPIAQRQEPLYEWQCLDRILASTVLLLFLCRQWHEAVVEPVGPYIRGVPRIVVRFLGGPRPPAHPLRTPMDRISYNHKLTGEI
jgi:hypothetical protein